MLELVATGPQPRQRIALALKPGNEYLIGRDGAADIPVPWDDRISRRHVKLKLNGNGAEVTRCEGASNPIFFEGKRNDAFTVPVGRHFVIGETVFQVRQSDSPSTVVGNRAPAREYTFDQKELQKVRYQDADKRINVLSHLPEVIWGARTETELFDRLAKLILAGVTQAEAVAIVEVSSQGPPKIRHWERRRETKGEFRPSTRLMSDAVREKRRTILQVWDGETISDDEYTAVAEFDWAFCTPVIVPAGNAWGLYVAGKQDKPYLSIPPVDKGGPGGITARNDSSHLQADVKFTELVAEIVAAVRRVNVLERERAGFRQFFAPAVLSTLEDNPDLLEPRETDVTALFCDLRGFSKTAEASAEDLLGLLNRVSSALEIMTEQILAHGGVTADFMGDAALGFWGWPISSPEAPLDACRAALGIREAFDKIRQDKSHPLANFSMGIGIAHGRAVAGKIGTRDQVKVSVFGPVVNLASRLEGMTKQLRVPIVMDDTTAELVRQRSARTQPGGFDDNKAVGQRPDGSRPDGFPGRVRRLATVLPYGMEIPVSVSELVPPLEQCPELTDELLDLYDRGVDLFEKGEWEEAHRCFHKMPETDRAHDFPAIRIAQHNRVAPEDWDGIVRLGSK